MLPETWLRHASRPIVIAVFTATALVALWLTWLALFGTAVLPPNVGAPAPPGAIGDLATYRRIVEAMRGGEGYYEAAHAALLDGGYGTLSVFNWRTPLNAWLLAALPSLNWGLALGVGLAVVATLLAYRLLRDSAGPLFAGVGLLALLVSLANLGSADAMHFSDITAGTLILLSVVAYGLRLAGPGFVAGALALFLRELAGVYVVVCLVLAIRQRRWAEVGGWLVVLAAYAGYFLWHAQMVAAQLGPLDRAYPDSWLAFGGGAFLLATGAFNGLVKLLPLWVTALLLPLGLLGLTARPAGLRAAATAFAYAALFLVAGKSYNSYWGALYTPLLMLGLPWAAAAIRDGLAVLRRSRSSSVAPAGVPRSGSSPPSAGGSVR
jgi:hypothetical protein